MFYTGSSNGLIIDDRSLARHYVTVVEVTFVRALILSHFLAIVLYSHHNIK